MERGVGEDREKLEGSKGVGEGEGGVFGSDADCLGSVHKKSL
jgi:hypothetical protein